MAAVVIILLACLLYSSSYSLSHYAELYQVVKDGMRLTDISFK